MDGNNRFERSSSQSDAALSRPVAPPLTGRAAVGRLTTRGQRQAGDKRRSSSRHQPSKPDNRALLAGYHSDGRRGRGMVTLGSKFSLMFGCSSR